MLPPAATDPNPPRAGVRRARYRRILCPVDFSELMPRVVEHAVAIARFYGAELDMIHVLPRAVTTLGPGGDHPAFYSLPQEPYQGHLHRAASPALAAHVPTRTDVLEGAAASTILDRAAARGCDLVVMGTHARTGLSRLLLGSVADAVLRHAPCPVLVVPPHDRTTPSAPTFRSIVCPVDFTRASLAALEHALALAAEAGGTLTLLHVIAPPAVPSIEGGPWAPPPTWSEDDAARELRRLVAPEARTWCEVREVVERGPVEERLMGHVAQADLVVLGVHERGALDVMLFGSLSRDIVRQAPCPVLAVRPSSGAES